MADSPDSRDNHAGKAERATWSTGLTGFGLTNDNASGAAAGAITTCVLRFWLDGGHITHQSDYSLIALPLNFQHERTYVCVLAGFVTVIWIEMIYGLQVLWKCGLLLSDARLFIKTRCRSACTISIMLTYPSSRFGVAHSVRGDLSVADQKFVMAIGQVRVLLPPRHRGFQFWH